ncbi:MAG: acylphosphatase, partial [Actinobacteria bacterium]|nr:acylphosphatase [Actinomycetota bacterium]
MISKTFQIEITGIVQGVGFRPFIYKLASNSKLHGDVCNTTSGVIIRINSADENEVNDFILKIKSQKPEPAVIEDIKVRKIANLPFNDFKIIKSKPSEEKFQLVSPDLATCSKCVRDINNNKNKRRFNYAFTNCTNCGPRFTIIKKLPYDRQNTTMADFLMCPE